MPEDVEPETAERERGCWRAVWDEFRNWIVGT
jgi:hypothetical protein